MPSELPFFFGGALTYCVYEQVQQNPQMTQLLKRFGPWALGFMCFSIILGRQLGIFRFQSSAYFMFFCVALLPIFEWCRGSRVDYWLGELSFPVYLLHSALLTLWPKARFGGGHSSRRKSIFGHGTCHWPELSDDPVRTAHPRPIQGKA